MPIMQIKNSAGAISVELSNCYKCAICDPNTIDDNPRLLSAFKLEKRTAPRSPENPTRWWNRVARFHQVALMNLVFKSIDSIL